MTRSTFSFRYQVYKITHGQWEMFDHCPQVDHILSVLLPRSLYIKGKLSISITFAYFSSSFVLKSQRRLFKVLALSFKRFSIRHFLPMLSDVSFINSRPLMLPVVQFSFAKTACDFPGY